MNSNVAINKKLTQEDIEKLIEIRKGIISLMEQEIQLRGKSKITEYQIRNLKTQKNYLISLEAAYKIRGLVK